MNEFDIISKYFLPLAKNHPSALDFKDDAAQFAVDSGYDLIITQDAIAENVHFFEKTPADLIAKKLLRTNLSDLAAKGAQPVAYLLSLILHEAADEEWLNLFSHGMMEDVNQYGGALIGGDTVKGAGALSLSLTAIGKVRKNKMIKRKYAKAGDYIYVSGTIGDSYLGLQILKGNISGLDKAVEEYFVSCYHMPSPRIGLGSSLIDIANSSIDISDSLVADLGHICEYSGVGAVVNTSLIPISGQALTISDRWNIGELITAGDDYEILFTISARNHSEIMKIARKTGVRITMIGEITDGGEVIIEDSSRNKLDLSNKGYSHF